MRPLRYADLAEALAQSLPAAPEAAVSVNELADRLGMSESLVGKRLRKMARQIGLRCGFRLAVRIDGRPCRTPVYWVERPKASR